MKTPFTRKRLKHHFTYAWWKYLAAVLGCLLVMNLFFSVTSARPRDDQKVDLFVYGSTTESLLDAWMENLRAEEFPEQALFDCYSVSSGVTSGVQVFTTRVAVGDGDLLLIPRETFETFAQEGLLMPLEEQPWMAEELSVHHIDPETGYWRGPDGVRRLYAVPVGQMPVLSSMMLDSETDYYLGVRIRNGNEETVWQVLRFMLRDLCEGSETVTLTTLMDTQYQ